MSTIVNNVVVGEPDAEPSWGSHVKGVHEGNHPGLILRRKARRSMVPRHGRSTGINARSRSPIHPAMPPLSPP